MLGDNPHAERRDELKDDGRRHVLDACHRPQRDPPERGTDHNAPHHGEQKRRRHGADREAVRDGGANRKAVDQERTGVVQQALAFEDRQDAMRRAKLTEHRGRGRGIGWGDDRTQRDRRRPRHRGNERPRDEGDRNGREPDGDHDQPGDGRPVVAEIPGRGVVGRVEQDGRDEERQRQFGRQRERRRAWDEREQRAAEREQNGKRRADAPRETGQAHGGDKEHEKLFEFPHPKVAG